MTRKGSENCQAAIGTLVEEFKEVFKVGERLKTMTGIVCDGLGLKLHN